MLFLTEEIVQGARLDRSHPRDKIFAHLEQACDKHLSLTPDALFQLGPRLNSFVVWRAAIEELGAMSALSDDDRYLDHLVTLVMSLANGGWHDAGFDRHLSVPFVLTALACCYDLQSEHLQAARGSTEQVIVEMAEFLARELSTKRWGRPDRIAWNHTIIGYAALGVAALALLDRHPDARAWLDTALDRCRRFLDVGLTSAGMTWEGLTYCGFVFKHLGAVLCGLRNLGLEADLVPPDSAAERKLRRVPIWYAHEMFPQGQYVQNYNDSEWDPHRAMWGFLPSFSSYEPDLCALIWDRLIGKAGLRTYGAHARWPSLADAMWFYPEARDGEPLARLDKTFFSADVGYMSARDDWSEAASVFTFNSGRYLGNVHDQADNNSFTFIASGSPVVIDSGGANDKREGTPSSSLGHNLVLIDGVGEHIAGEGVGVSGRIRAIAHTHDTVCIVGDAQESYSHDGYNRVSHALRTAVFVRGPIPYVLIHDDIQKDAKRRFYEFVVHVPAGDESAFTCASPCAVVHDQAGRGVGAIEFLHPASVRATAQEFESRSRPFSKHRLWRFGTDAVNPHFLVLLRPLLLGTEAPEVQVNETNEDFTVTVRWSFGVDEVVFPRQVVGAPHRDDQVPIVSRSA